MIHTAEVLTGFERRGIMAFKMLGKIGFTELPVSEIT